MPVLQRSTTHAIRVRRIAAIGQTVNAAEALYKDELYRRDGILRGQARSTNAPIARRSPRLAQLLDSPRTATVLNAVNLGCGVATLAFADRRPVRITTALLSAAVGSLSAQRNPFGRDGSDQMQHVIHAYDLAAAVVPASADGDDIFLRVVNGQLAISYCASGLIKLVSDDWRSGRALTLVMRTSMYGSPTLSRVLDRYPLLGKLICWQTIAWETLFPVTYFLPDSVARRSLAFAKLFHLGIGHFMGLPRFIWAFAATHPAAEYVLAERNNSVRQLTPAIGLQRKAAA